MKHLCLLLAVCVAGLVARADQRDDERRGHRERGPRVIVYQHTDYRGSSFVLYPGDTLESLSDLRFENGGRLNDTISSIRIEGEVEIYVYEHAGFRGPVMRLAESVRDLTTRLLPDSVAVSWNDRISSLRVDERRRGPGGRRVDPDEILRRAFRDLLGREPDLSGLGSLRSMIVDQGWTEEMVRDNIRRGDEFRNEGANRIIQQAYLDVLGRKPNGGELAKYRRKLLDDKWLGNDVREDLKRSEEYRRKPGEQPGRETKPSEPRNRRN